MVPAEEWERVKPFLIPAIERDGTHTLSDVEAKIFAHKAILLAGEKSALVAEVDEYPQTKVLRIWLGGGDLNELKSWLNELLELGRSLGCSRLKIEGRDGWVRALKSLGLDRSWSVIEKDIT